MNDNIHITELAEGYYAGTLDAGAQAGLDARLASDPAFAAEFGESLALIQSLEGAGRTSRFRSMLKDVAAEKPLEEKNITRTIPLRAHYFRTATLAAGIAIVASTLTLWTAERATRTKRAAPYATLRREIEAVRRGHNKLVYSHNQVVANLNTGVRARPVAPVAASGSGFALTGDGYLVTNYHVAQDADSIYIQTRNGENYKASLVTFNPQADVAVLKVEDEDFRFGNGELPYAFAQRKAGLGARVFTLGFPQDEVVYNEGYISAKNGYGGDSLQYRLELSAQAGQSGAPVLDAAGNVVAIVTGREAEAGGPTYAVSTRALLDLLDSMPRGLKLSLPKTSRLGRMNREQQIDKLEDYTCIVRVYKK